MKSWVYFARYGIDGPIKIGRAANPQKRVQDLGVGSSVALVLLGALLSESSEEDEAEIHARLQEHCLRGEWFMAEAALQEMQRLEARVVPPEELVKQETPNDVLDTCVNLRVSSEEIYAWKLAARRAGMSLSQWARSQFNAACEEDCAIFAVRRTFDLVPEAEATIAGDSQRFYQEVVRRQSQSFGGGAEHTALAARVAQLEGVLSEALDIAEWEASESCGKKEHLERLSHLRQVLAAKVALSSP